MGVNELAALLEDDRVPEEIKVKIRQAILLETVSKDLGKILNEHLERINDDKKL